MNFELRVSTMIGTLLSAEHEMGLAMATEDHSQLDLNDRMGRCLTQTLFNVSRIEITQNLLLIVPI